MPESESITMSVDLRLGDCLEVMRTMESGSVHCCITSPPYWGLRDYGVEGQIGLEKTPEEFVARMVDVFREVRRVLRGDGTCWLNLGDSYGAGKQLLMIPHRVALSLQADSWIVRSDIIWHKPNAMPESIRDRPTKSHEYMFLLAKSERYHYDVDAVREENSPNSHARGKDGSKTQDRSRAGNIRVPGAKVSGLMTDHPLGRNRRSVWTVATSHFNGAHFATFPPRLIEPCILAGCPIGGTTLDPFSGAATTGVVAVQHGRSYVGIELNPEYMAIARRRIAAELAKTALLTA